MMRSYSFMLSYSMSRLIVGPKQWSALYIEVQPTLQFVDNAEIILFEAERGIRISHPE